jgi:hypothetical protein
MRASNIASRAVEVGSQPPVLVAVKQRLKADVGLSL